MFFKINTSHNCLKFLASLVFIFIIITTSCREPINSDNEIANSNNKADHPPQLEGSADVIAQGSVDQCDDELKLLCEFSIDNKIDHDQVDHMLTAKIESSSEKCDIDSSALKTILSKYSNMSLASQDYADLVSQCVSSLK